MIAVNVLSEKQTRVVVRPALPSKLRLGSSEDTSAAHSSVATSAFSQFQSESNRSHPPSPLLSIYILCILRWPLAAQMRNPANSASSMQTSACEAVRVSVVVLDSPPATGPSGESAFFASLRGQLGS